MRIIITGGSGFIGSTLAEQLLSDGHEVILLVRSDKKKSNINDFADKVIVEYCDVTDQKRINEVISTRSPDAVFHFAGQLTTYESFENPLYDVDVNSKSTIMILEAIRNLKKPCRFLLGSTFWVVGRPEKLPVTEKDRCNPRSIYGADRLASEYYCFIYNIVYGLDTVVLRFTNTYGPKEQYLNPKKAALNYLLYKGFKGEDVTIYNKGEFFRDYIYVTDVVSACKTILEKGKSGEIYFVGSGIKTWFYEIAKLIEEMTKAKIVYIEAPEYHKKIDIGNFVVDNNKLRNLGWMPTITIREGMKNILDYFKTLDVKQ